jgi:hypothetical protein
MSDIDDILCVTLERDEWDDYADLIQRTWERLARR